MVRYKILIEYHGEAFCGWQKQNHSPSIQEEIEDAIYYLSNQRVEVIGAGRTDAGVHALGQVAHFDICSKREYTTREIEGGLNHYLSSYPISILSACKVDQGFHARFSAKSRQYRYKILNRRAPLSLHKGLFWHVIEDLDHAYMHQAAQILIGKHDFTSFRTTQCQSHSPVKTISSIEIKRDMDIITMVIEAPSFLHNQVRIIIGTLRNLGNHKWDISRLNKILELKDRKAAGQTAPPSGLYLDKIAY